VICYVEMDHPRVWVDPKLRARRLGILGARKLRFEAISGQPCLLLHHTQISTALLRRTGVRALMLGGSTVDWHDFDLHQFDPLADAIRTGEFPTIAFCGGHQWLGHAHGSQWGPVGRLAPGEADPAPQMAPGWRKEVGFMPVDTLEDDPLFAGLPTAPVMYQSHYWHLHDVPVGWRLLATRPTCRVQAMRHPDLPIYGTQFHPEQYDSAHTDGITLLRNFFAMAGIAPRDGEIAQMTRWFRATGPDLAAEL
jgi:GMP synthase-like glutamine amidotransferase